MEETEGLFIFVRNGEGFFGGGGAGRHFPDGPSRRRPAWSAAAPPDHTSRAGKGANATRQGTQAAAFMSTRPQAASALTQADAGRGLYVHKGRKADALQATSASHRA